MKKHDIVLITESRFEKPTIKDAFINNVLLEDKYVQEALEKRGFKVIRKDWASTDFDWSSAAYSIIRTPWDYAERFDEFSSWLKKTEQKTTLINPTKTIYWNLDKHYLDDLFEKGINIIQTKYIEKNDSISLAELHQKTGWTETILKPVVSGGARHTYRIDKTNLSRHEGIFQQLISEEAMMLQPFQDYILDYGEVSYILFDGKFSHAVLKKAKKGDFRVQDDFGGSIEPYSPNKEEIIFAEKAANACDPLPVYARVDVIRDNDNHLSVVELELVEPELWFRLFPPAAELFAEAIVKHLKKSALQPS